jgi:hypothetical protein
MSSSTRWTSRALVAAGVGGLLALGAAFGAGNVSAASADDTPPTTAPPEPATTAAGERPGTLPPTTASPDRPTRVARERPGTLPSAAAPAEPVPGVPNYTG